MRLLTIISLFLSLLSSLSMSSFNDISLLTLNNTRCRDGDTLSAEYDELRNTYMRYNNGAVTSEDADIDQTYDIPSGRHALQPGRQASAPNATGRGSTSTDNKGLAVTTVNDDAAEFMHGRIDSPEARRRLMRCIKSDGLPG
jgi:hypothetical protein